MRIAYISDDHHENYISDDHDENHIIDDHDENYISDQDYTCLGQTGWPRWSPVYPEQPIVITWINDIL